MRAKPRAARIPILASRVGALIVAVLIASCGTASDGVELTEPAPTIFSEEELAIAEDAIEAGTTSTSTSTVPEPVARELPALAHDDVARAVVTPTGIVVGVVAPQDEGWLVLSPCGNEVPISVGTPISAAHVVLDPGHGGSETGAVGDGGLRESDVNLAMAELVAKELEDAGVEVILTRTADARSTLASRAFIATSLGAMAFVSIHHNAEPDGPSNRPGTEMWYQIDDPESRRLGGLLYESTLDVLAQYEVAWVADDDAGVKFRLNERGTDYYGILRNSVGVPTVLAELAFLSNPAEEQLLATSESRSEIASAVAEAIERFLTTDDPGSGFVEAYEREQPAGPGGGAEGCVDPPLE